MIVELGGGKGGLKEYLEHGKKKGRDMHRDQLDQRIPLIGDLNVFEIATSSQEGDGDRYDHITLSFSESYVSDAMLQAVAIEFRDHVLAAWPESERHRVAFYAEAHRPRIQRYTNSETGVEVARLTHVHVGLGKHDLLTGASIEPLGFLGPMSDNLKYIDAWQESFNARYGFSSPKDNPKISPENAVDVLARYTGQRPDELGSFNGRKAALEVAVQKEVIANNITTWDGLGELLAKHGVVSKLRAGQFGECYRVKPHGQGRAMRLQGVFFQRQFIERPTAEKVAIVADRARTAYLEQMQPRKAPAYVANVLREWRLFKAREHRYLHTGDSFYKNIYKPADGPARLQLLDQLERKNHAIQSLSPAQIGAAAATRNRVPKMPVRNLDGIQSRSEMLLRDHSGLDVRAESAGESDGASVRQTDGYGGRGGQRGIDGQRRLGTVEASQEGQDVGKRNSKIQPSSVLARIRADLRERYDQAADKERYAEIRRNIDCLQLLARLSHSHGLDPGLYSVFNAIDGTPRIVCGSRNLSPNDFLSKEMGLPWREAAPILRAVYEHQIGKAIASRVERAAPAQLWADFKTSQLAAAAAIKLRLHSFDSETKALRVALSTALRDEQTRALSKLSGHAKKSALSIAKLNAAIAKAQLTEERREARKSIRPQQAEAWRNFLQARASEGNETARAALRRLDSEARAAPVHAITGTIHLVDDEDEKRRRKRARKAAGEILRMLSHQVEINGDVTYSNHGRAVLRDEGQHIAIIDQNSEDAILAGLLLAREKFGADLTLTGGPEFQRRVVQIAAMHGIAVKFVDPQLEAMRQSLLKSTGSESRLPPPPPKQFEQDSEVNPQRQVTSSQVSAELPAEKPETPCTDAMQLDVAQAQIIGELKAQGMQVLEIEEGEHYVGKVLKITDRFVVHKVGRASVVVHSVGRVLGTCEVGQNAHILYVAGGGGVILHQPREGQGMDL